LKNCSIEECAFLSFLPIYINPIIFIQFDFLVPLILIGLVALSAQLTCFDISAIHYVKVPMLNKLLCYFCTPLFLHTSTEEVKNQNEVSYTK